MSPRCFLCGTSSELWTTESRFIVGPGGVCPFGFQSKLASAGFSLGTPVFLLHWKLGFLNKSISGNISSYSASANWQLIRHCTLSPLMWYMSRITKSQIYLFLYFYYFITCLPFSIYVCLLSLPSQKNPILRSHQEDLLFLSKCHMCIHRNLYMGPH